MDRQHWPQQYTASAASSGRLQSVFTLAANSQGQYPTLALLSGWRLCLSVHLMGSSADILGAWS